MTTVKKYAIPFLAALLILAGLAGPYVQDYSGWNIVGPQAITAVVVEETAARPELPTGQIAALSSVKARAWAKQKGYSFLVVDKDVKGPDKDKGKTPGQTAAPPEQLVPYLKQALSKPLPWLIIVNDGGRVLWEGAVPNGEDELLAILKKYGGE